MSPTRRYNVVCIPPCLFFNVDIITVLQTSASAKNPDMIVPETCGRAPFHQNKIHGPNAMHMFFGRGECVLAGDMSEVCLHPRLVPNPWPTGKGKEVS
jgi:hypothetical protein